MKDQTESSAGTHSAKTLRVYQAPQLVVYGAVRELTAAGSTGATEGMMATNLMKQRI